MCWVRKQYFPERWVAMASISSKNTTQGLQALARLKRERIARSESPTYLLNSYGPLMARKLSPDSVAIALASIVLLHPGGPNNRIPLLGSTPKAANRAASRRGSSTTLRIYRLTSSYPPICPHLTSGTSTTSSRISAGRCLRSSSSRRALSSPDPHFRKASLSNCLISPMVKPLRRKLALRRDSGERGSCSDSRATIRESTSKRVEWPGRESATSFSKRPEDRRERANYLSES